MVDQNLIRDIDISDEALDNELTVVFCEGAEWSAIAEEIYPTLQ